MPHFHGFAHVIMKSCHKSVSLYLSPGELFLIDWDGGSVLQPELHGVCRVAARASVWSSVTALAGIPDWLVPEH